MSNLTPSRTLFDLYQRCFESPAGDKTQIVEELKKIQSDLQCSRSEGVEKTYAVYASLIGLHAPLSPELATLTLAAERTPFADIGSTLGEIPHQRPPGISLVTCSKNRTQNLLKALPSWTRCREISEIVIVDWGSDIPVSQELSEAGVADPRIRVIRVENEPRWILSYAFNVGFRAASYDTVLKADADIVLSEDFFSRNHLAGNSFVAGNWRSAAADQAFVNGFFYLPLRALHDVNGFNEFITTYGWDDDDIYERLVLAGYERIDVASDTIFHLPHSDDERVGSSADGAAASMSMRRHLSEGTGLLINTNRIIAALMPTWTTDQTLLPFNVQSVEGTVLTVRRQGWVPSEVPAHLQAMAKTQALTDMLSWRLGPRVRHLTPDTVLKLLERPADELSRLDVEVAIVAPHATLAGKDRYLVLSVQNLDHLGTRYEGAFANLLAAAKHCNLQPVVYAPCGQMPDAVAASLSDLPLVPNWENIGEMDPVSVAELKPAAPHQATSPIVQIDAESLAALSLSAPQVSIPRRRIFIDAQHGLGNRMRAIASAAVVAEATDRELVVVWEPDHHCEGRLSDLFDYDGAVIETAFVERARQQDCAVFNYMEIEEGSEKDAPIDPTIDADIYARSAYVLQAPQSNWEAENQFLRSLVPVQAVRDMVASVRSPNDLSAHVRMVGGREYEHLSYESLDNWTEEGHALTDFWRKKSHFSHFIKRIDTLLSEGRAERIFLAADKPETYDVFVQTFGDRVAYLPRELYDRSSEQLRYALADVILLGTSPLLLGSSWSSFSEMAMRMSHKNMKIEMSGKDF